MMFFFFGHRISKFPRPIAVKLCHVINICVDFIIQAQKALTKITLGKIWAILHNFRIWSRISPEREKIFKIWKTSDR